MRRVLNPGRLAALWRTTATSEGGGSGGAPGEPSIAPKRSKKRIVPQVDTAELLKSIPRDPGAHAELSTAELERKIEEWSKLPPEELEELYKKFEADEDAESRVLRDDSLYQMDVSLKSRSNSAVKVFWKDVEVVSIGEQYPGWYGVAVDGKRVRAFESRSILAIPSEEMAYACAHEYAEQQGYLNKLNMPLTDLCSGAMHVAPQMIAPRIDYLMSFLRNDNCYFRSPQIQREQDELIDPIARWFERVFEVEVPRIVGIGHPHVPPHHVEAVQRALLALEMNQYQIVSLCVAAQFTSSLILPLALFNRVVDIPKALSINRAEEGHSVDAHGLIHGYHDIREADASVKICAAATAWRLMSSVPRTTCSQLPSASALDEAESP
jgi:chaperone required for assembly of F1-ATPase